MAITAAAIMTTPVITVLPDTSVADSAVLLATRKISAVPVCTADGALAGLVSEQDVIRQLTATARARRDWWLGALG